MKMSGTVSKVAVTCGAVAVLTLGTSFAALAYDGQHCAEPGVCWQPQPGHPEKLSGSKYDVKQYEEPSEVAKQGKSEREMEARNEQRIQNFQKTGKFEYDVKKIAK